MSFETIRSITDTAEQANLEGARTKSMPLVVPTREEVLAGPNIVCLETAASWTRRPADFVVDLSGNQIKHWLSAPQAHLRHGSYRNRFSDVLVFGHHHFHGFLAPDGRIDCQELGATQHRLDTHLQYHPGPDAPIPQICRTGQGYEVSFDKMECENLEGSLYFGTPIEPDNWGMWLLQAIPNAIDFLSHDQADRFLAYVGRDWQRRFLIDVGIPEDRLVNQELGRTYHCDDLFVKQFSHIDLVPSPLEREALARVASYFTNAQGGNAGCRLFISRRTVTRETNGNYRALQNEEELVDAFSAEGYEIVEPELMPFPDQIRLFAQARLVVGLGGAGLFNIIFSHPTTRVISIESSADFVHNHACLFGSLGHPFAFIFGRQDPDDETPVQKRWTIDVDGVMKTLHEYE